MVIHVPFYRPPWVNWGFALDDLAFVLRTICTGFLDTAIFLWRKFLELLSAKAEFPVPTGRVPDELDVSKVSYILSREIRKWDNPHDLLISTTLSKAFTFYPWNKGQQRSQQIPRFGSIESFFCSFHLWGFHNLAFDMMILVLSVPDLILIDFTLASRKSRVLSSFTSHSHTWYIKRSEFTSNS